MAIICYIFKSFNIFIKQINKLSVFLCYTYNGDHMNRIAQIFGILAILVWIVSIRKKKKKDIAFLQIISNGLYAVQYSMLGAITAACMNSLSFIRCIIMYIDIKKKKKTSKYIILFFVLLMIAIGIYSYNGIISTIPTFLTCLYAYSLWQKNMKVHYFIIVFAAFLWIVYNYYVGAYISLLGNVFEIICGITSLIELKKEK